MSSSVYSLLSEVHTMTWGHSVTCFYIDSMIVAFTKKKNGARTAVLENGATLEGGAPK